MRQRNNQPNPWISLSLSAQNFLHHVLEWLSLPYDAGGVHACETRTELAWVNSRSKPATEETAGIQAFLISRT